jgi:hypothetical protein
MFESFRVAKDTILPAGTYLNSGLNPAIGEYESFPGKYYRGDVTIYESYKNGYYQKILVYKDECGNILNLKGYNNDSHRQYKQIARGQSYETDTRSDIRSELRKPVQPLREESFSTPKNVSEDKVNLYLPRTEEPYSPPKKNIGDGWFIVPSAIIGTGILTYFILKNNLKKSSPSDNTGHGIDPPPPPPDPGGNGIDPPPPPP